MARDCIPRSLSNFFYAYGKFVTRHPLPFLLIPLAVAGALSVGIINLEVTNEAEYLYAPIGSRSKDERSYFMDKFPNDDFSFSLIRILELTGFIQVIIEDKNNLNILNDDALTSIRELDDLIISHKVEHEGNIFNYSDICSMNNGECIYSDFIKILIDQPVNADDVVITFPNHQLSTGEYLNLIHVIGGSELNNSGVVLSARSIELNYFIRTQEAAWLDDIRDELLKYSDANVEVTFRSSRSLAEVLTSSLESILPLLIVAFVVLALFAIFSCMVFDWVRSKPHVALGGLFASMLGISSAVGILSAAGVKFATVVGTMPFLVIGIGLDDMFILVSAWRYTSVKLSSEERMGETLRSAAVSITITSVTDALAFGIGCFTPFRSITIFCAYTGVAVILVYIYMITFTVACMVYSGRREEANRHPLTCMRVVSKTDAESHIKVYQLCCSGGSMKNEIERQPGMKEKTDVHSMHKKMVQDDPLLLKGVQLPWLNRFLGTTFAKILLTAPVKICVLLVYFGMITGAIYGITVLNQGIDPQNLAPDNSYFKDFIEKHTRDFSSNYGMVVMVAIDEPLHWTNQTVRDDVNDLIKTFRNDEYIVTDPNFVGFWFYAFERYLSLSGRNISHFPTMSHLIAELREVFLQQNAFQDYKADLVFSSDNTSIEACRFFVQSTALKSSTDEKNLMVNVREIADDSKFEVIVFQPGFIYFDQYLVIADVTMQNIGIAVASMFVVSLTFIPSLSTAFWVALTALSICTCVVGYMSLWSVNLDSISMINLIMCIGFSVDFAAHISYHYVIATSKDPKKKASKALHYVGTPIVQGAVSTILAVVALSTSDTYIFRTFFKLVFLVMVFGFYHALFLLPVLLSTLNFDNCENKLCTNETKSSNLPIQASSASVDHGRFYQPVSDARWSQPLNGVTSYQRTNMHNWPWYSRFYEPKMYYNQMKYPSTQHLALGYNMHMHHKNRMDPYYHGRRNLR